MEIPTKEIIEQLTNLINTADPEHRQVTKSVLIKLHAIEVIEKQAREILDLQATICRLKDEYRISSDLRELEKN